MKFRLLQGAKIEHLPAKPHLSWEQEVLWENFSQFYKKNFPGKNFYLASQWVKKWGFSMVKNKGNC